MTEFEPDAEGLPSAEDVAWLADQQADAEAALTAQQVADEIAAARLSVEHHRAARAQHIAPRAQAPFRRLFDESEPHPRALHVPCEGDPATGERGCRAGYGIGCRHPNGRDVAGYVHPSRLRAELAYIANATVTV